MSRSHQNRWPLRLAMFDSTNSVIGSTASIETMESESPDWCHCRRKCAWLGDATTNWSSLVNLPTAKRSVNCFGRWKITTKISFLKIWAFFRYFYFKKNFPFLHTLGFSFAVRQVEERHRHGCGSWFAIPRILVTEPIPSTHSTGWTKSVLNFWDNHLFRCRWLFPSILNRNIGRQNQFELNSFFSVQNLVWHKVKCREGYFFLFILGQTLIKLQVSKPLLSDQGKCGEG